MPQAETPEQRAARLARKSVNARAWYLRNREKVIAASRAYYLTADKERRRIKSTEWSKRNPDKIKAAARRWREKHPLVARARIKQWQQQNKAHVARKQRERFLQLSPEKREVDRARIRKWAREHPEVNLAHCQKRRALKLQVAVNPERITEWMVALRSGPALPCYYCQIPISGTQIHFDHVIPLSRGGPHEIGNMAASCRGCNLSKSSRFLGVWNVKSGQQVLSL